MTSASAWVAPRSSAIATARSAIARPLSPLAPPPRAHRAPTPTWTSRKRAPLQPCPTCIPWSGWPLPQFVMPTSVHDARVGDRVARAPELGRDARVRRVPIELAELAALDLARDLAAELEVQPPVVDRPAAVRLEEEPVVGVRDDVLEAHAVARLAG